MKKYESARALKNKIDFVRKEYMKDLNSDDQSNRQRATAVWIIDKLAIRVGNEKDTSITADTVGVCTLRLEHIKFLDDNTIKLDFLGKDSIRYQNKTKIDRVVYKNLKYFCKNKISSDIIFDKLNTRIVNAYLSELSENLTAKVFRTFNASITLQNELAKEKVDKRKTIDQKKYFYDEANRQVAILCNHQKTVSKTFNASLQKQLDRLNEMKIKLKELKKEYKSVSDTTKETETTKKNAKRKRNPMVVKNMIKRLKVRIEKQGFNIKLKKSTKEIALGTSKINYMDPRISVAWCKRNEMPIEKIFQKALLDKFPWALSIDPNFEF
ncbi:hypothetical protein MHBO_003115 [Bonamia ostreae]|uniref:DNA topoisomerase n=1 Tax=Bonamia ostreae TaxID=126728 RepID=A0ABV2API2_9EUKA